MFEISPQNWRNQEYKPIKLSRESYYKSWTIVKRKFVKNLHRNNIQTKLNIKSEISSNKGFIIMTEKIVLILECFDRNKGFPLRTRLMYKGEPRGAHGPKRIINKDSSSTKHCFIFNVYTFTRRQCGNLLKDNIWARLWERDAAIFVCCCTGNNTALSSVKLNWRQYTNGLRINCPSFILMSEKNITAKTRAR